MRSVILYVLYVIEYELDHALPSLYNMLVKELRKSVLFIEV